MTDSYHWNPIPAAPAYAEPEPQRRWLRWLGITAVVIAFAALGALTAYLWIVNEQWTSQNAELRTQATELGAQVADAQASALEAESALETLDTQLSNATSRISDLANEEATANDSLQFLENLVDAMITCADERQAHIESISRQGLSYANSNARTVENQITDFCAGVEETYADYLSAKDS